MKYHYPTLTRWTLIAITVLAGLPVSAQEETTDNSAVFELSPFEVSTDRIYGYRASSSVSGTRTATAVRNLPFSLQIVTDELIDDLNVTDLEDALLYTSGVQENRDNVGNFGKFNVRGIQQNYTLRNGFRHYGPNDTAAIAQVEIVKGPAGLLYGQVFPGGVINAVSKKPLTIPKYELEVQYGSYGSYRTELDFGGPLNEKKTLAYRLIGAYSDWDSFVQYYGRTIQSIVPMIQFEPFEKVKFTFEFEHYLSEEEAPHAGGIAINRDDLQTAIENPDDPFGVANGPFDTRVVRSDSFTGLADFLPRSFNTNGPGTYNNYEKVSYSLYTDIRITDWLDFRSAVIHTDYEQERYANFINNSMRTGIDFFSEAAYSESGNEVFTAQNDFSAKFTTGGIDHSLLFGVEFYRDQFDSYSAKENPPPGSNSRYYVRLPSPYDFITRDWSLETRFLNPIDDWSPSPRPEDLQEPSLLFDRETEGLAYYLVDQLALMDERLRIVAGARYEEYDSENFLTNDSGTESDTIFQGGAMFNLNDWLSVFGSYSQSFYRNEFYQYGPPGNAGLIGKLPPPQEGDGIDFGLKWETANGRFAGTISYFDLSQSNILLKVQVDGAPKDVLSGERTSRGFELDMHIAPLESWQIIFNYAFIEAEDKERGMPLPNVPKHQASVWTRYEFTEGKLEGLFLGGGARYLGDRPAGNDSNLFEQRWEFDAKGYVHLDLFAGKSFQWNDHDIQVQLNISNVTDKEYIRGGQTLPSEPRRYMVSVKTTW